MPISSMLLVLAFSGAAPSPSRGGGPSENWPGRLVSAVWSVAVAGNL